jgi:hypothetical protein
MLVRFWCVGIGLELLLVADSPDQTASRSEFNAARTEKTHVNNWRCGAFLENDGGKIVEDSPI